MMPTNWTTGGNPNVRPTAAIATAGSNSSRRQEEEKVGRAPWSESLFPPPETTPLPFREQRIAYFRNHYDFMTGIRIAGTLGGFFLIVLLTLLYKSKCKKSSHLPSPALSMDRIGQDFPAQNGIPLYSHHSPLQETRLLFMDGGRPSPERPELLLTSPLDLSESSTESDVSINFPPRPTLRLVEPPRGKRKRRGEKGSPPPRVPSFLNQQIDIHIIQPTPSISPSNSEMFPPRPNQKLSGPESQWKRSPHRNSTGHRASDSDVMSPLLIFLHAENLKFMDDTSSENLPNDEVESPSIGSDSVFTFACDRRRSSASAYTGLEEDDENCGLTLSQATAQVHHRDSFCSSEVESDYLEVRGRRSSSTQTTFSDLRKTLPSPSSNTPSNGGLDPNFFNIHNLLPPEQPNRIPPTSRKESLKKTSIPIGGHATTAEPFHPLKPNNQLKSSELRIQD